VEAPKGAIYGALYFGSPEIQTNFLWLAVYNLSSLNINKVLPLKGREVVLFPDLSQDGQAFDLWSNKARDFSRVMPDTIFKVSNLLETHATPEQRVKGCDIADFLQRHDWDAFTGRPVHRLPKDKTPVIYFEAHKNYSEMDVMNIIKNSVSDKNVKEIFTELKNTNYIRYCNITKTYWYSPF
jgi:hypothetical protein